MEHDAAPTAAFPPTAQLRMHIGCASIRLPGYINMDVRETEATDLVGPAWDLAGIADDSVAEVYTRHTIEHLEPEDAIRSVREWRRVLRPGGFANIICPDLEFHARQLLGQARSTVSNDQFSHALAGFYGWKDVRRGGNVHDAHRWGYTAASMAELLRSAGYRTVDRVLTGKDSEPWHLNVKAYK